MDKRIRLVAWALLGAAALGFPTAARAQVQIAARLGFPTGKGTGKFKSGAWAPVLVTMTNNSEQTIPGGQLIAETADSDDVPSQVIVPIKEALLPNTPVVIRTFIRPGNGSGLVNVTVKGPDGQKVLGTAKTSVNYKDSLGPATALYVLAGSGVPEQIRRGLLPPGNKGEDEEATTNATNRAYDFVTVMDVQDLPARWYGYQAVDLLILTTGNQKFADDLRDSEDRLPALAEWVRRGGRLVISGSGTRLAQLWNTKKDEQGKTVRAGLGELLGLQALEVDPTQPTIEWPRLGSVETWVRKPGQMEGDNPVGRNGFVPHRAEIKAIPVANLKLAARPVRRLDVLVGRPGGDGGQNNDDRPLIVQAPAALGRVMVVAFDLDAAPFTAWSSQEDFWRMLNLTFGVRAEEVAQQQLIGKQGGFGGDYNEIGSRLVDAMETFDEVPVVSFGWVALLILLYIVVVGPLDYWFLKKVVKRLELTWLTFPAVVLTISVGAYFIAYWLKGNDLKINKADVVDLVADVDLTDPSRTTTTHAQGTTWFTLFSPQIKHYTLGIEPAAPGWAENPDTREENPYSVVASALSRPENVYGGVSRQGSGGLFRRAYQYAPDAAGLEGVPIQVWSTKSFTASWETELPKGNSILTAQLRHTDGNGVAGEIEHHLPTTLHDVVLFYNGNVLKIGDLAPGQKCPVDSRQMPGGVQLPEIWFGTSASFATNYSATGPGRRGQSTNSEPVSSLIKPILFYNLNPNKNGLRNSSLRDLDESWRVVDKTRSREEVVLFGRTDRKEGPAEDMTRDGISPTRLWLENLPGQGHERARLAGTLTQETYVRVFIPVLQK